VGGINTSYAEMMALPNSQVDNVYWLPWYNSKDLDTQLRIANLSSSTATVHVSIGGLPVTGSPFTITAGASIRRTFPGIDRGLVKIESDQDIVASERVIYKVNSVNTSYSEMVALPEIQQDLVYWLPWYNNLEADTQLRFANVSSSTATVRVFIAGQQMAGSPFTLTAGRARRVSFPGINGGPVKIESDQNIVASARVIYRTSAGMPTSYSEMMALPNAQLGNTYWLPWYNNVGLSTQLRLANVSGSPASVHVFIGGKEMAGSPFTLGANTGIRRSFRGVDSGPVQIVSDHGLPIVASTRVIYRVNNTLASYSELMGFPAGQLDTIFWLPWYNNVELNTSLIFGAP
jgi:hypothetical protein